MSSPDQLYLKRERLSQLSDFFYNCISSGVIPKGLQLDFNLANFHYNRDLQLSILDVLNIASSRILELLLHQCNSELNSIDDDVFAFFVNFIPFFSLVGVTF